MAWLSFVLGGTARDLRRSGTAGAVAILLVALAVLAIGATVLGRAALTRLTGTWRAGLRIVAVLREDGARENGAPAVVPAVQGLPGVGAVRYVSRADALAELKQHLGSLGVGGDGLERLPLNPVPARLVIVPAAGLEAAGLRGLVDALGRLPAVEEVQAPVGWVEPAERVERGLTRAGLGLGTLLGLAALLAIAAGAALARQRRADETAILRLAGASELTLRAPLVLQAILQGTAGAALGVGVLVLVSETAAPWTADWLRASLGLAALPPPGWRLVAALAGGGAGAGLAGGLAGGRP
jgi:cell division protein FtsX